MANLNIGLVVATGMDDYREDPDKWYLTSLVISPDGDIVGEHKKTRLTKGDIKEGYSAGSSVEAIDTPFGKIGLAVCYELHFADICKAYTDQGAKIIFNTIGFGMFDEEQFRLWNGIAMVRAYENKCHVLGCCHFDGEIPLAFAYGPWGKCLLSERAKAAGCFMVDIPRPYL